MREIVLAWRTEFATQFAILHTVATDTTVTAEHRQAVFGTIADNAAIHAQVLHQPTRSRLHAQLSKQAGALPAPYQAMHARVIDALQTTPCDAMCQL